MWFPKGIFKVQISHSKKKFESFVEKFSTAALQALWRRDFDITVTMFSVGKIGGEDTVDCPRFVAFEFEGASHEDSSSSFNIPVGQLTKSESDKIWRGRSTIRVERSMMAGAILFGVAERIWFTFTWNRPLCVVLFFFFFGGGGARVHTSRHTFCTSTGCLRLLLKSSVVALMYCSFSLVLTKS